MQYSVVVPCTLYMFPLALVLQMFLIKLTIYIILKRREGQLRLGALNLIIYCQPSASKKTKTLSNLQETQEAVWSYAWNLPFIIHATQTLWRPRKLFPTSSPKLLICLHKATNLSFLMIQADFVKLVSLQFMHFFAQKFVALNPALYFWLAFLNSEWLWHTIKLT